MAVPAVTQAAAERRVWVVPSALPVLSATRGTAPARREVIGRALRTVAMGVPGSELGGAFVAAQSLSGLTEKGLLFGVAAYVKIQEVRAKWQEPGGGAPIRTWPEGRPVGDRFPDRGRFLDVKL